MIRIAQVNALPCAGPMPNSMLRRLKDWLAGVGSPRPDPIHEPAAAAVSESSPIAGVATPSEFAESQQALRDGRFEVATSILERVVENDPQNQAAHVNLGFALTQLSRPAEAIPVLRTALELDLRSADTHYLLGGALADVGDHVTAIRHFETALDIQPDLVFAQRDLAKALHGAGRSGQARDLLARALAVRPDVADFHYFLGNIQQHQHDPEAALESYRMALSLDPAYASIRSNMAPAYLAIGEFEMAAEAARAALAIDPLMYPARSNLLVALSSTPACSPEEYLVEARRYGDIATANAGGHAVRPPVRSRRIDGSEPLRVGFISGDLHSHPVGYFFEGLMAAWDPEDMVAVAYSSQHGDDALTARLKPGFAEWHDIAALTHAAAARRIRDDEIDVLIDLSGHTAENRLPVFALRPAPLQLTWLGYWASTGLPSIDCVLADEVSLPTSEQHHFTERVAYLPVTRFCFTPPADDAAALYGMVAPTPAVKNGYITFGSFQRLTKISASMVALWAAVLKAVPRSRLRLQAAKLASEPTRSTWLAKLRAHGIDLTSVDLVDATSRAEYFKAHGAVDIILDTYPYTGATTTCEALWMCVPTVTLAGRTMLSRQGASLMGSVGLSDWVAYDDVSFVALAVAHASDVSRLAHVRLHLREKLLSSPLTDALAFARHFQALLRSLAVATAARETPASISRR